MFEVNVIGEKKLSWGFNVLHMLQK